MMSSKIERYNRRYGITTRIIGLFFLLVFIPYLILAFIMFRGFKSYMISTMSSAIENTLSIVSNEIDSSLHKYEEISMGLYYGGYVDMLTENVDETVINTELKDMCNSDSRIRAAFLITADQSFQGNDRYPDFLQTMEPYTQEIRAEGGGCMWYAFDELYGKTTEKTYVLARSLNGKKQNDIGVFYLVLGNDIVKDVYSQLTSGYTEEYLADAKGNVLFEAKASSKTAMPDLNRIDTKVRNGICEMDYKGSTCTLVYSRLSNADWYCISIIPMSTVKQDIAILLRPFFLLSFVYMVCLVLMLALLRYYVFRPLGQLKQIMDKYACSDLKPIQCQEIGVGEVRSLSKHFNQMITRTWKLLNDFKSEVDEKNRQKMLALSSQLTPHFIYNALNTIKWMAVLNKQDNIQNLTESLIFIFKNAARIDDDTYTLEDELNLVQKYAVIQKARFMSFDLVIEVEPECMTCRVRKFMLQPIVENSIVHGLQRGAIKKGIITIKAWKDEILHITVRDNGCGFDLEKWRNQQPKQKGNEHTNIGIYNVSALISLEYGPEYGLSIDSMPGEGTVVTYRIPIRKGSEQEEEPYDSYDNN